MATKKTTAEVAPPEEGNGLPAPVAMAPVIPAADLGQGTRVEMSRAVAEVQAMVIVAQARPRNIREATDDMLRTCQMEEMAEQAFYRYPRGKDDQGRTNYVTGPTVQLMRAIMGCWGNCQSGIGELRRFDPAGGKPGMSEMQAWAWDLQKNFRTSTSFFATWRRDTKYGVVELDADRDVYDNNANLGSRRERTMIEHVLPPWYVEQAKRTCQQTLVGKPEEFNGRVDEVIALFAEMGVTKDMLEQRRGAPRPVWRAVDLGGLKVMYNMLLRGEVTVEEEFPEARKGGRKGSAAATLAEAKAAGDQGDAVGGAPERSGGEPPGDGEPRLPAGEREAVPAERAKADRPAPRRQRPRQQDAEPRSAAEAWDQAAPLGGDEG